MGKTIFLANFIKNFFFVTPQAPFLKKIFDNLSKKMVFFIFKVNLDFNYLCPFSIFKLNIFQKIELW